MGQSHKSQPEIVEMHKVLFVAVVLSVLGLALGHTPKTPKPGDGGGSGGGGSGGGWSGGGSCPRPSPEVIRCMQEWACRQVIRLDLRCLLNLNGNNLLGSLVNVHGVTGGAGGAGAGGAGILNTLLNGK